MRVVAACAFGAVAMATGVAGAAGTLFQPYQAFPVGSWPEAVAIGDVTGDGRADVVMTTGFYFDSANDYRVWVFAQTGGGTLAAPVSYPTGSSATPESVQIGDVTGDGRKDVVVGLDGVGVQMYPQLASGTLGSPTLTSTADGRIVRLGRLNGDARLDVAAVGWGTNTVSVLLNDGAGGLQAPISYPAQHAGYDDLDVADVTGDGRDDLVVMSGQTYSVPNLSVLPQLAGGGFGPAAEYRVAPNANTNGVAVGDVTGDGRKDVIVSYGGNRPSSNLAVFPQSSSGALGAPVTYPSYDIPEPVEVADVDRDGRDDVVTLHGGWNSAGVYLRQPAGGLAGEDLYAIPYASHYEAQGLAVGDVSGDGAQDLAIADYNHGLVVLYGTAPPPVADVSVDVTASGSRVKPRKSFWFDIAMRNAGPDSASASLVVQLGGEPTGVSVNDSRCSLGGSTVSCSFTGLAPGSTVTVRLAGTAPNKGTLSASATVDGAANDPNAANDADSASIQIR
jgi:uncharacterized protein DUF11/VCBS repeat protein